MNDWYPGGAEWDECKPEEPVYYYFIQDDGRIGVDAVNPYNHKSKMEEHKSIGNYFNTREEAEKAVEKLKAWKRLKDNWGLKPENWHRVDDDTIAVRFGVGVHIDMPIQEDLDLLFGGEE